MPTNVVDLMGQMRVYVSDSPQRVEDRQYTDRQLADFVPPAISDMNIQAIIAHTSSGVGPANMSISPVLSTENEELFKLYFAKTVFQYEADEARRVGFRVQNVAGTVDGRGRFTSTREGIRDITTRINRILKLQTNRAAAGAGTFRSMARKADPDNTESGELG